MRARVCTHLDITPGWNVWRSLTPRVEMSTWIWKLNWEFEAHLHAHRHTAKYTNVSASFGSVCALAAVVVVVVVYMMLSCKVYWFHWIHSYRTGTSAECTIGASFWKLLEFCYLRIIFRGEREEGVWMVKVINGFDTKRKYFASISRSLNFE